MSVANNHAGDAGLLTVADSTAALRSHGIEPVAESRSNRRSSPATASVWPSSRSIYRRRNRLRASLDGTGTRPASRCGRHEAGPTSSPSRSTAASRCRASRTPRSGLTRGCSPAGTSTPARCQHPTRCSRSGSWLHDDRRVTVVATSLGNLLFDGVGAGGAAGGGGRPRRGGRLPELDCCLRRRARHVPAVGPPRRCVRAGRRDPGTAPRGPGGRAMRPSTTSYP